MFLLHQLDHTVKKVKEQLANALTLLNVSLGVCASLFALQDELHIALLLIIIAALCDRLDWACAGVLRALQNLVNN